MEFKNCIIHTHEDLTLSRKVIKLLKDLGYDRLYDGAFSSIVTGQWFPGNERAVLQGDFNYNKKAKPKWPVFDAATEWDKLEGFLRGEPEFDETPLPNTMDKETEDRIKRDFNLSPDQWEMMTPMVRAALAGAEVKVEINKVVGTHEWKPISEYPGRDGISVILTNNPRAVLDDAYNFLATGFKSEGEWEIMRGPDDFRPTHYCLLPGPQEDDEEYDDE